MVDKLGLDYFRFQKKDAAYRGIPFLFTYEEWVKIWTDSNHAHEKGCHRGQYVMARFGDKGAYEIGNVRIATTEENHAEQWGRPEYATKMSAIHTDKDVSLETRKKISAARKDSKASEETKAKMSISQRGNQNAVGNQNWTGRHHSEETKQILREKNTGKKASVETRKKMSVKLIGNQNALGLVHSEESRRKTSEGNRRRWAKWRAARDQELSL
jgi:hypothetical protein